MIKNFNILVFYRSIDIKFHIIFYQYFYAIDGENLYPLLNYKFMYDKKLYEFLDDIVSKENLLSIFSQNRSKTISHFYSLSGIFNNMLTIKYFSQ